MNILSLIKQRSENNFGHGVQDEMLKKIVQSNEDSIAFITTENELSKNSGTNSEYISRIKNNYSLKGMFELGDVLPNACAKLVLYIFTKQKMDQFVVGEYHGIVKENASKNVDICDYNTLYSDQYYEYLKLIEKWCDSGKIGNNENSFFNTLKSEQFEDSFSPKRYSQKVFKIKEALKNASTVLLSSVAEVLSPRVVEDYSEKAVHLPVSEWRYPIDYDRLSEGVLTNIPIKKNDILFMDFQHIYLVDKETEQELHINPEFFVIRPYNILPQYLFLYLQSETAQTIIQSLSHGSVFNRINKKELLDIPILKPSLEDSEYYQTFYLKNYKPKDIEEYSRNNRLLAYYKAFIKMREKNNDEVKQSILIDNILEEEWAQNIKICKKENLKEFLESDIKEINICFRNKAYKATLILAGSVLEGILIDWLSEIKGEDYFEKQYMVKKQRLDKKNQPILDKYGRFQYFEKEAALVDYINEIKVLARPKWMKAEEAHIIRKKRNLVHAKLCLSESKGINEETCKEVIQYLKEVIETRCGYIH